MFMSEFCAALNEDQLQIQKWVHDFAESVVRPAGSEWDEREEFPYPIVEEAAQIGLYGVDFLMNAIGDTSGLTLPVAVEELFWGDAGIGMAIMGSALAAAGISEVHVVVAAVDPELKGRGQASFVVPPGTKGLSQGQKYKMHGIRASHTAEVVLDDVRVPGRCLLGGKEKLDAKLSRAREGAQTGAAQPAMATFEATRPSVAAMAIGIARAAYEVALDYAKERVAFGKPIIQNQAIAFMLADMATKIDAARLPVYRMHRVAKIYDIFEGTEQIQQLVIARAITGLRIE